MTRHYPRFVTNETKIERGVRRSFTIPNPAAGANWSVNVPGGRMWRLVGGQAFFQASAAVGSRNLGLNVQTAQTAMQVSYNSTAIAAAGNGSAIYTPSGAGVLAASINTLLPVPFTPTWLEPGDTLRSITANLDAADQYSNITLWIEELWFDNQDLNDEVDEVERIIRHLVRSVK